MWRMPPPALAAHAVAVAAAALALAAFGPINELLSDHLLRRVVSRRSWLEPHLLGWHHAQRRRAIHLELAVGSGARRNVQPGHD